MKLLWTSVVFLLHVSVLKGQFSVTNYNTSNSGLTNNNIFSVTIDKDNNAWFGAYDNPEGYGGIVSFNGNEWDVLRLDEDTNHSYINNITEIIFGPNNDMWVFSYSGGGSRITKKNSTWCIDVTPSEDIFGSHGISYNQSIWFINIWSGLYEYNYDSLKWIFHNNFPVDPQFNPITSFGVDSTGTYWIGIGNKNMYRYKDTILSKISLFPEYPPNGKTWYSFNSTAFATDGSVWFATNLGLVHYFDKDNYKIYNTSNSNLPTNEIDKVIIDKRGYVWFSTYDWTNVNYRGLGFWDGSNFTSYNKENSEIGSNEIRDIEEDKEGNIWIATWGGGVSKFTYDPTSVDILQPNQNTVVAFPNPVKSDDELTIYHDTQTKLTSFSLWSIDGILINKYELENVNDEYRINVLGITSGFYLGIATDLEGNQFTTKIVVVD